MGHTLSLEYHAIWKILVVGIILGAGLPALFAGGIRATAFGRGGDAEVATAGGAPAAASPIGTVVGYICFAVVAVIVAVGLVFLVVTGQGKVMDFSHGYPQIHAKK